MASLNTREIDISIDETLGGNAQPCPLAEEWLRKVVGRALEVALPADQPGQVSLLVTDDGTVQELNRKYRGLDEVTDVLSFSTANPGHWEGDAPDAGRGDSLLTPAEPDGYTSGFIFPADQAPPLGEVIISYAQALRQAESRHEPVERELALLVIHGVLHLVGYDHLEADDTAEMQAKEREALETIFPLGTDR